MKSTLRNMVFSLTGLTLFVGVALAVVSLITAQPIADAGRKARIAAMSDILPRFDNEILSEVIECEDGIFLYPATLEGVAVGAAVETYSDDGFSGRFSLIVGFDSSGVLKGYRVLEHAETPGLGAKMSDWFSMAGSRHCVLGTAGVLSLSADGGDIDAITGATITSRAFIGAVNKARQAFDNYNTGANE